MIAEKPGDDLYMLRCLQLAEHGLGHVAPNPMVGCVIVYQNQIIGEGYHRRFGGAHAEVNAILSVNDHSLLSESTLYVNLEPCAHYGKTPPCASLILEKKIPRVVIASLDPHSLVSGKGITLLRENGVEVITGVLEKEHRWLNRRYFTAIEQNRPYIILKWAQTADGFIDKDRLQNEKGGLAISCRDSQQRNHLWRSEEQAILIGKRTAFTDNPTLTTRLVSGQNPTRILLDPNLEIPINFNIFNSDALTIVIADKKSENKSPDNKTEVQYIDYSKNSINQILALLSGLNIQSVIVEGGAFTHHQFIESGMWDEARIITSPLCLNEGIPAAHLTHAKHIQKEISDVDTIDTYINQKE